jgi:cytochrome c
MKNASSEEICRRQALARILSWQYFDFFNRIEGTTDRVLNVDQIVEPASDRMASPGRGTAIEGEAVYVAKCQPCHGEKGTKSNDALAGALVGDMGTLASDKIPTKTVGSFWPYPTTLFDYVRRAMPFQESKSLTADELYRYRPISSISTGSSGRTM